MRHLRYPEAAALDAVDKLVFMEILIKEKSFLLHKPVAVVREMSPFAFNLLHTGSR